MKTSLLVMCLALLPLTAQDDTEIQHLTVGALPNGRPPTPTLRLAAKSLEQSAGLVYLKGSVEISMPLYTLVADEADYDRESGEIQDRGNVHLKPVILNSRGASQFGIK